MAYSMHGVRRNLSALAHSLSPTQRRALLSLSRAWSPRDSMPKGTNARGLRLLEAYKAIEYRAYPGPNGWPNWHVRLTKRGTELVAAVRALATENHDSTDRNDA